MLSLWLIAFIVKLHEVKNKLSKCNNVFYDYNGKDIILEHDQLQSVIDAYYNYIPKEDSIEIADFMFKE